MESLNPVPAKIQQFEEERMKLIEAVKELHLLLQSRSAVDNNAVERRNKQKLDALAKMEDAQQSVVAVDSVSSSTTTTRSAHSGRFVKSADKKDRLRQRIEEEASEQMWLLDFADAMTRRIGELDTNVVASESKNATPAPLMSIHHKQSIAKFVSRIMSLLEPPPIEKPAPYQTDEVVLVLEHLRAAGRISPNDIGQLLNRNVQYGNSNFPARLAAAKKRLGVEEEAEEPEGMMTHAMLNPKQPTKTKFDQLVDFMKERVKERRAGRIKSQLTKNGIRLMIEKLDLGLPSSDTTLALALKAAGVSFPL